MKDIPGSSPGRHGLKARWARTSTLWTIMQSGGGGFGSLGWLIGHPGSKPPEHHHSLPSLSVSFSLHKTLWLIIDPGASVRSLIIIIIIIVIIKVVPYDCLKQNTMNTFNVDLNNPKTQLEKRLWTEPWYARVKNSYNNHLQETQPIWMPKRCTDIEKLMKLLKKYRGWAKLSKSKLGERVYFGLATFFIFF